jgi:hypothetical protein
MFPTSLIQKPSSIPTLLPARLPFGYQDDLPVQYLSSRADRKALAMYVVARVLNLSIPVLLCCCSFEIMLHNKTLASEYGIVFE